MFRIMTLFFLIISFHPLEVKAVNIMSASDLYDACKAPESSQDFAVCIGFFSGFASSSILATVATINAIELETGRKSPDVAYRASDIVGDLFGCAENTPIARAAKLYVVFLDSNPKLKENLAHESVSIMYNKFYPCK